MFETEIESATSNVTIEIEASVGDYDVELSGEADVEYAEENYHADGKADYDFNGVSGDVEGEAYSIIDDDTATVYYNYGDGWYMEEEDTEDAGIDTKAVGKIKDAAQELLSAGKVESKKAEVSGEKCYVIDVNPTGEECADFLKAVAKAGGYSDDWSDLCDEIEDEYDIKVEDILGCLNFKMTLYVSVKNGYCMQAVLDMSGFDAEALAELSDDLADDLEDIDLDLSEVEISKASVTVTMSDINDTEVEVPKKVKEEAEENASYDDYDDSNLWATDDGNTYYIEDTTTDINGTTDTTDDTATETTDYSDADSFELRDYDGNYVMTINLPDGYVFDTEYSDWIDGNYVYVYRPEDEYETEFDIVYYGDEDIISYLNDGTFDTEWYSSFEASVTDSFEIGDYQVNILYKTYSWTGSDYTSTYYYAYIPYTDAYGNQEYVSVELSYEASTNWTEDDFINFFTQVLGQ